MNINITQAINTLSSYADQGLAAAGLENKAWLIAAPAAGIAVLSTGARVTMGAGALLCKGASKAAELAGKNEFSAKCTNAQNTLIAGALSKPVFEIKAALALTALAGLGAAASVGYEQLFPTPPPPPPVQPPVELTNVQELTKFAKLSYNHFSPGFFPKIEV